MSAPLNASASQAGALFSNSRFEVPQYQREYSWQRDEVDEFWSDLKNSINYDEYFLGLIILTDEDGIKKVVDGQQRIITLTLLTNALYYSAISLGRTALADRIQADFIRYIDYATDAQAPRLTLSDDHDNATLQHILDTGQIPEISDDDDEVSKSIIDSYRYLSEHLSEDLRRDAFRRLGEWTDFLTNRLYFAVFVHPDPASAYQVFEVINTRGRELTTADLLKNYILSQAVPAQRNEQYDRWQALSRQFAPDGSNNTFVQYIRHAVTAGSGHILPKDLYSFLSGRRPGTGRRPPAPLDLVTLLEGQAPLYLQMVDPTLPGPAEGRALQTFAAFNSLAVIAVRPILLALYGTAGATEGMDFLLRLVVRRIVVGNLGTGNVERRLGEAARAVSDTGDWTVLTNDLSDLNPSEDEFREQLRKRSFNKNTLAFMRRSIVQNDTAPEPLGVLHFIWPKTSIEWPGFSKEDSYWLSTIGNTFLADSARRPREATEDWEGFKSGLLPHAVDGEWSMQLEAISAWDANTIEEMGRDLSAAAAAIWY